MSQAPQQTSYQSLPPVALPTYPAPMHDVYRYWPSTVPYQYPISSHPVWNGPIRYNQPVHPDYAAFFVGLNGQFYQPFDVSPHLAGQNVYPSHAAAPLVNNKTDVSYLQQQPTLPLSICEKMMPPIQPFDVSVPPRIHPQNHRPSPVVMTNPRVKQEAPNDRSMPFLAPNTTPRPRETQTQNVLRAESAPVVGNNTGHLSLKDDKIRRISAWRAQVESLTAYDHSRDVAAEPIVDVSDPSRDRGNFYPALKRKADTAGPEIYSSNPFSLPVTSASKRARTVSGPDKPMLVTPQKRGSRKQGAEKRRSPCPACRTAHKKCDGRLSKCIFHVRNSHDRPL
ncbi:uncharacterized protein FOMMEDRAFT_16138 [Fomitiporia mediterranea MF3/22]|uniref:uncharacterized protein n=1 Tax=Fomitiporia mediterranea (strain MF3/22) TaxID=694068 RepID=UPI0004407369|nr:uncharacterized protein FOMMEDRAFT_16138 [Fomitiporia mediterranea MF3/22]EJD07474.1 hypothetical protein FOMMEDRAFT_16138 [Fomitiporia mediterranea MF3/22]